MKTWVLIIGALLILGGGIFGAMIAIDQAPWFGLGVGVLMALLFLGGMNRGCKLTLDEDRKLTYSVAGKSNLSLPVDQCSEWRCIEAGLLKGIGCRVEDWESIEWKHKSGISFTTMRKCRERLGVDLIFEFFSSEDLAELRRRSALPGTNAAG
jgi:hypothetical protein